MPGGRAGLRSGAAVLIAAVVAASAGGPAGAATADTGGGGSATPGSGSGSGSGGSGSGASGPPTALPEAPMVTEGGECLPPSETVIDREVWTEGALGLPEARGFTEGGGAAVAVLGSGVDDTAAALDGAVEGAGEDCVGFGTFLAGIVAARAQDGSGMVGVAPAARVLAVGVTDDRGVAGARDVAEGIESAVGDGADVVLVGAPVPAAGGDTGMEAALRAAADADALVVAPATVPTDDGPVAALPQPGPGVLAVAATGPDGAPAESGPTVDADGDPVRPDLAAPGRAAMGVGPGGDGHFTSGGDAVAAAFVAGAAALLRSHEPALSAAEAAERLTSTAYPAPGAASEALLGAGTLDPVAALTAVPAPREAGEAPEAAAFSPDPPTAPTVGRTLAVAGGSALLILVAALGAAAVRHGRARRT
ncbi:S8 family serine peptidase [Nocardiopsis suaedae]|uniref:S8 family serine peptidase n=1 Tax=Nocardiopsis suaedae TaxID=3018444 RepID=A0ABT4TKR2_9ACTN|nr:S8 family serine peptidase [Nocardiopsis suaedae]MDA2805260.1 S8 family serine peptidase [Nocardiopsis suaedae]